MFPSFSNNGVALRQNLEEESLTDGFGISFHALEMSWLILWLHCSNTSHIVSSWTEILFWKCHKRTSVGQRGRLWLGKTKNQRSLWTCGLLDGRYWCQVWERRSLVSKEAPGNRMVHRSFLSNREQAFPVLVLRRFLLWFRTHATIQQGVQEKTSSSGIFAPDSVLSKQIQVFKILFVWQ